MGLAQGNLTLCRACRFPLTPEDMKHADFIEGQQMPSLWRAKICEKKSARAPAEREKQIRLAKERGPRAHRRTMLQKFAEENKKRMKELREEQRKLNAEAAKA